VVALAKETVFKFVHPLKGTVSSAIKANLGRFTVVNAVQP
jgi:hypothetical protein